jgi:hypothetical protein
MKIISSMYPMPSVGGCETLDESETPFIQPESAPDDRPALILQPRRFQAPPLASTSFVTFYSLDAMGQWRVVMRGAWVPCDKP